MSAVSFSSHPALSALAPVAIPQAANQNQSFYHVVTGNPFAPLSGVLPNGQSFTWHVLGVDAIPAMLELQHAVASAATGKEKTFLIKRTAEDFGYSLSQNHLYWGAWVNDQLVGLFGLADNDEEVGDGRGEKTPKDALAVDEYAQASILKGAQVHPDYRDQGLGVLGALSRYACFMSHPAKQVMMTKVSADNDKVCSNYLKNGFADVYRTSVTDRGQTFELITFAAKRSVLKHWLAAKAGTIAKQFQLQLQFAFDTTA